MSEIIDNRAKRIQTLKEIIKKLHRGETPESVKRELTEIVRQTDSTEIAAMEQELMAEGMAVEEVQSMCDLHSEVLRDLIVEAVPAEIQPGHPLDTFKRENDAIGEVAAGMKKSLEEIEAAADDAPVSGQVESLREQFNSLMDVEKHYRRKENLLFSCLERHGVSGPSKVMWGKDDEVRELLKALGEALGEKGASAGDWKLVAETVARPALAAVKEMIFKETEILFPMSEQTLTGDEWGEIWSQSPEYGYCLIEPREGYLPPAQTGPEKEARIASGESIVFATGSLTYDQLRAVFASLPVDVTFVDDQDRVAFFSEGGRRIFSRSKAIIGRKVQHCHPPKSVNIVEGIVSDFRAGRQDVAEFWIQSQGRFIHIRYFAVRDQAGKYLGTLETTQDVTGIKSLEGERRLLAYEK